MSGWPSPGIAIGGRLPGGQPAGRSELDRARRGGGAPAAAPLPPSVSTSSWPSWRLWAAVRRRRASAWRGGSCPGAVETGRRSRPSPPPRARGSCRSRHDGSSGHLRLPGSGSRRDAARWPRTAAGGLRGPDRSSAIRSSSGASVGCRAAPTRANGSHAKTNTMSEPRKYGYVCQLLVKNSTRLRRSPTMAAGRVRSPVVTSSPTAISTSATPTPARPGWGMANARSRKPPGAPWANPRSCVPMYVGAPGCRKPGSLSFWMPP